MSKNKIITVIAPKKILNAWINDLETCDPSKQGRGTMENHGRYCCLGRLQKVVDGKVERERDGKACKLPSNVWLESKGIKFFDESGYLYNSPYLPSLEADAAEANDSTIPNNSVSFSFKDIAAALRKCSKGV